MNVIIAQRKEGEPMPLFPDISLCPGAGVVMPGRGPLFIPAWYQGEALLTPVPVLRLSRLGKNIERKFASRYYNAMAVGVLVRPADMDAVPRELAAAADSAMALGAWVPLQPDEPVTIEVPSPQLSLSLPSMATFADEVIVTLSRYMTLRMGDLLVPFLPEVQFPAPQNQMLNISLNGVPSLEVKIK